MKLAYKQSNGIIAIVHAAPRAHIERAIGKFADESAYERHVVERSIPAGATDLIRLSDDWQPPSDQDQRSKWVIRNGTIEIDQAN